MWSLKDRKYVLIYKMVNIWQSRSTRWVDLPGNVHVKQRNRIYLNILLRDSLYKFGMLHNVIKRIDDKS